MFTFFNFYLLAHTKKLPIFIILPTLHALIVYFMVGYGCNTENFLVFLFALVLVANAAYSLGHLLSIIASDPTMTVSLAAPAIVTQMLFSGFFLNKA